MVTALKLEKDINKISPEELVSSLRIHEIELEDDEPQKQGKPLALKSNKKHDSKVLQDMEETSAGSSSEEDAFSLISRRVNQLWKQRQRKFRNSKRSGNQNESSSDTEILSLPLDAEGLKLLMVTESQTTETSSTMSAMNKGTIKVIVQGF